MILIKELWNAALGAGMIESSFIKFDDQIEVHHSSIIAKEQGLLWRNIKKFAELQKELGFNLKQLLDLADDILKKEVYTLSDILNILEIEEVEFQEIFLSANTKEMTKFHLRNRALHVLQGEQMIKVVKPFI